MAAKPQKSLAVPMRLARPNEGVAIDLVQRKIVDKNGNSVSILSGDMTNAPVPDRRYSAEVADVVMHRNLVRLMFAQEEANLVSLRSMVVVSVRTTGMRQFLDSLKRLDGGVTLEALAKTSGVVADELTPIKSDAVQGNIGVRASNIVMAIANDEACLDFYQASAFAVRAGSFSNKLAIEPVVRVELNFSLFLGLVKKLWALEKDWPTDDVLNLHGVQK